MVQLLNLSRRLPGRGRKQTTSANVKTSSSETGGNTSGPGGSAAASQDPPLILRLNVKCGRNLAPKDRGGTSDPFLVVTLGESKESTPSISKTLNPEWNVVFEFPIIGVPLLECVCWDKDRFGKDYMGEFNLDLEGVFTDGQIETPPQWYQLFSRRKSAKDATVSGEILLQFSLFDPSRPSDAPADEIYQKFKNATKMDDEDEDGEDEDEDEDEDEESSVMETEGVPTGLSDQGEVKKPENVQKHKRKLERLKRQSLAARAYQFSGAKDGVAGIVFMEIVKVTDLPPERNVTRTGFDMDPFVVTSLGRKTLRTRVIRHNLNPVFEEKMVFQVMKREQSYQINFTVMDRDKLSGNDYVASADFPLHTLMLYAPTADPETGLYDIPGLTETASNEGSTSRSRFKNLKPSSALAKFPKNPLRKKYSSPSLTTSSSALTAEPSPSCQSEESSDPSEPSSGPPEPSNLRLYTIPLEMARKERWEDTHSPELQIRAKYMPYRALRQQFWRVMLKQYDGEEGSRLGKVELVALLDTLGSTLKESTIDSFFERFAEENEPAKTTDLTVDQAVQCFEDTLQALQKKRNRADNISVSSSISPPDSSAPGPSTGSGSGSGSDRLRKSSSVPATSSASPPPSSMNSSKQTLKEPIPELKLTASTPGVAPLIRGHPPSRPEGNDGPADDSLLDLESSQKFDPGLHPDDLGEDQEEEHVVEIHQCPLCHQPRLSKRSDADIITHIATCASQDWKQVDNLVMGGFVTSSQAQRKWYTKVVTKLSYGGYALGANSANILVQDRITGQINEEKMSVYVRLGIRMLYKGLKSRDMEKGKIRRMLKSLSLKQGRKYDDPISVSQIAGFIDFHRLNMDDVLLPIDQFKTFNEFFYRALKPGARPCSAPDNPHIVVSPADCRTVVFNNITDATKIWVKGREFTIKRLLGDAYPDDVWRYANGGAIGIFRLAPQDYHRFHIPVDGVLGTPKTIEGEYYTVNPMAIRSALDVYGENVRVLVSIDSEIFGRVMVICVGAMMVGSTEITRKPGEEVKRAEELGYFKFGGSTLLVLFEPGKIEFDADLVTNSLNPLETLVRVGMSIGHSVNEPEFVPDYIRDVSTLSAEEIEAARRRIEGIED